MFTRIGARFLERTSPAGMALAGTMLVLTVPAVRKSLRSAAVMATRGMLMITDTVLHTGTVIKEEMEDIIAEARETDCPMCTSMKDRQRRLASATSSGLMSVSHKAKSLSDKVRRFASDQDHLNSPDEFDGLEAEH